ALRQGRLSVCSRDWARSQRAVSKLETRNATQIDQSSSSRTSDRLKIKDLATVPATDVDPVLTAIFKTAVNPRRPATGLNTRMFQKCGLVLDKVRTPPRPDSHKRSQSFERSGIDCVRLRGGRGTEDCGIGRILTPTPDAARRRGTQRFKLQHGAML